MESSSTPVSAWTLRRHFTGEPKGVEAEGVAGHNGWSSACRGKLRLLEDEQARFMREVPLERFVAGVERAARTPIPAQRDTWLRPLLAVAATLVVCVAVQPLLSARRHERNH